MSKTTVKPWYKSKNFWTGISTIALAAFGILSIQPDPAAADQLTGIGAKLIEAIKQQNWAAAAIVLFNSANILYHLFRTWFFPPTQAP